MGPKKATQRRKKEYLRYRKLLREDARANQKEDKRWERLHSEGTTKRNTLINFILIKET